MVTGKGGLNSGGSSGNDCRVVADAVGAFSAKSPPTSAKSPAASGMPDTEQVEERIARLQVGDGLLGLREVVGVEAPEQAAVDQHQAARGPCSPAGR